MTVPVDIEDLEIARGIMKRTWEAATTALVMGVVTFCFNLANIPGLLAFFGGIYTMHRALTVPRPFRDHVSATEKGLAVGAGLLAMLLGIVGTALPSLL